MAAKLTSKELTDRSAGTVAVGLFPPVGDDVVPHAATNTATTLEQAATVKRR
jgi:hypothetical protein